MELVARYRLPRHSIMELCDIVQQDIHRVTHHSHPLTVATQVLTALRFYMPRVVCRRMSMTCMASTIHLPHDRSLASQQQLHAWPGIIFLSHNQTSKKLCRILERWLIYLMLWGVWMAHRYHMHAIYTLMMKFVDLRLPRDCRLTIDQLIGVYKQHHVLRPSCAILWVWLARSLLV